MYSHVLPAVLSFVNSCLDDIKKVHLLLPKECTGAVQQCTAGCAVFRKLLLGLKESIFVVKECTGAVQQCTASCGVHRELLPERGGLPALPHQNHQEQHPLSYLSEIFFHCYDRILIVTET